MNVLLFALGSHGDVHPFVGIGIRLRQRGHHVAVASNEYFGPLIEAAGLEFLQFGTADEYTRLATDASLWHPLRSVKAVFGGTARYLRPMYDLAVEFARRDDAVIAASSLSLGARVAQDRFNLRLATVHLSPAIFQSIHDPAQVAGLNLLPRSTPLPVMRIVFRAINIVIDAMIAPAVNALRAEVGLPRVHGIIRDYWHSPLLTLGLFPDWFAAKQPDWPPQTRLTGFPLYDEPEITPISPALEQFLQTGDPPIAFTPGSAMWLGRRFFDASVETCVAMKRRGLLLTRHRDHLPPVLPPNVMHVDYAPFSQLLPRCAALVHHAGIGTTAQALAAGVPQLLTPFTHDQPDNAPRLARLGVGKILSPGRYRAANASAALRELIDSPTVAQACRAAQARLAGVDAIGQTCDLIESLGSGSAPHPSDAVAPKSGGR